MRQSEGMDETVCYEELRDIVKVDDVGGRGRWDRDVRFLSDNRRFAEKLYAGTGWRIG